MTVELPIFLPPLLVKRLPGATFIGNYLLQLLYIQLLWYPPPSPYQNKYALTTPVKYQGCLFVFLLPISRYTSYLSRFSISSPLSFIWRFAGGGLLYFTTSYIQYMRRRWRSVTPRKRGVDPKLLFFFLLFFFFNHYHPACGN